MKQEETHKVRLRNGQFFPAEPFRRIVTEWIEQQFRLWDGTDGKDILESEGVAPLAQLAKRIWRGSEQSGPRRLWGIRSGQSKWVSFDIADKIVLETLGPWGWHEDPELAELWATVDLTSVDVISPTCEKVETDLRERILAMLEQGGNKEGVARKLGVGTTTIERYLAGATGAAAA